MDIYACAHALQRARACAKHRGRCSVSTAADRNRRSLEYPRVPLEDPSITGEGDHSHAYPASAPACPQACMRSLQNTVTPHRVRRHGHILSRVRFPSRREGASPRRRSARQGPRPRAPRSRRQCAAACTGTWLTPATSAPRLGSPCPHLYRDWAHPAHICTGTGLTPPTSAPGLGRRGIRWAR